jgi:hypothetical protein
MYIHISGALKLMVGLGLEDLGFAQSFEVIDFVSNAHNCYYFCVLLRPFCVFLRIFAIDFVRNGPFTIVIIFASHSQINVLTQ